MIAKNVDAKAGDRKAVKTPQLLRGFKDILPGEEPYWNAVEDAARNIATSYSFGRLRLPILEQTSLFERSIGKATDVVEKEMYTFVDPSNTRVTLRPEATAGAARAYIEHGMVNKTQPVKMWYFEPMFRHDRPQAGRYRQFYQFGLEAIGSSDPILDAQMILMTHRFFKGLGVEVKFLLNSIGTEESRREYIMELVSYFKQFRKRLSEVDKKRLTKNPLRLLDSKEEGMDELRDGAPQILDWLDEDSKQHFMKVLEYLDEAEVPYELNPYLVRGLDYYTKTVFEVVEITDDAERAQNSLGGGGRYDTLIELLGGREDTPAIGIALGVERVIMAMKNQGVEFSKEREVDVFFCQLGDASRKKGLIVFEEFRKAGVSIAEAFGKGALKGQLEMADKQKAKIALILGQKEVLDGTIIIRDMESGAQEIVNIDKVVAIVKRQLEMMG
ncbi:MAG: Histidine-tRNA ligase [Candidatus Uhrbacteria bacterium GW2011_GWD2_41_121]|uniref:Histidine--tRNA ligase n=1 Tax=Candidatus Uhrbacteria bacterium GW2011_GWC1_41_20 TaxID=1618983 RepID=A0A0G0VE62_9BACT|nr:MAG: Histidine-tRNA ligase [Candidatus Uhrbacteria bacterium GW2011_GWE1_39_46]KKR64031.1 MAG: Histidine-tRNA ligase [Candidatus Uhrbacteria bacterium GW2011_GWC2_40_450]KKR89373.1 MAG: Histidine-tRNA ligase [Candidatus Uhrbacteria bacterium GW2011_GWE2_41_1153]KKR90109.1 MAG: Histidine-tRNA ligase [Candidatus Uhrbacteria bacterium GW2011_GWD2_41_121]KKR96065.1 MAG: Histidine-tRNA ligase [Candidatus Uhrbacteria bacterium GW2011_GWD1_41_16]KKR99124.1 MAG: histidyl-tRNA synthetase, class IIA,